MADVKWIKIATDIFDNRKIKQIEAMPKGEAIIVIWIKLICLAGAINDGGRIYFTDDIPYTPPPNLPGPCKLFVWPWTPSSDSA